MNDLTDFHSHILPGIDDGSASSEMSLAMLQQQWEAGVRRVVLTPHFYPERNSPERFLAQRAQAMERLKEACGERDLPRLYLGAEVAYFRGMSECEELKRLCIMDTRYILVELPMARWSRQVYEELEQIPAKQGLTPIVAHIDRYLTPFTAKSTVSRLLGLPVILQANASAFFRRGFVSTALGLVKSGAVELLGSDCHDLTARAPNMGRAAEVIVKKLGRQAVDRLEAIGRELLPEA